MGHDTSFLRSCSHTRPSGLQTRGGTHKGERDAEPQTRGHTCVGARESRVFTGAHCREHKLELGRARSEAEHIEEHSERRDRRQHILQHRIRGETRAPAYVGTMHDSSHQVAGVAVADAGCS
jgi:hypothetical protein